MSRQSGSKNMRIEEHVDNRDVLKGFGAYLNWSRVQYGEPLLDPGESRADSPP